RRSLLGNDDREVLLILEVLLRVEIDLASLFQTILGRLDLHLDRDLLSNLLARLDGRQWFILGRQRGGKRQQADEQQASRDHGILRYNVSSMAQFCSVEFLRLAADFVAEVARLQC